MSASGQGQSSGIEVTLSSLLYQAHIWEEQATVMRAISSTTNDLQYASGIKWVFTAAINPYNEACEFMSKLCSSGSTEMIKISSALLASHGTYRNIEEQIAAEIGKITF